jgi:biotin carboxylase
LGWGPAHIEIRDTSRGAAIVEINPRLAGGFIPELVRLATGIDLIRATLQLATGDQVGVQRTVDRHASIRFIMCPADGILSAVEGATMESMENTLADIRMYRQPGERVGIHYDFRDRIGHVIASAARGAEARAVAAAARDRIHVRVV